MGPLDDPRVVQHCHRPNRYLIANISQEASRDSVREGLVNRLKDLEYSTTGIGAVFVTIKNEANVHRAQPQSRYTQRTVRLCIFILSIIRSWVRVWIGTSTANESIIIKMQDISTLQQLQHCSFTGLYLLICIQWMKLALSCARACRAEQLVEYGHWPCIPAFERMSIIKDIYRIPKSMNFGPISTIIFKDLSYFDWNMDIIH
jgi:hypothetical protein